MNLKWKVQHASGREAAFRRWRPGGKLHAAWCGLAGLLLGLVAALSAEPMPAAPAAPDFAVEKRAFEAAARAFQDTVYELAESDFAEFVQVFPQSPLVPEAILYQARAALEQQKLQVALDLLTANVAKAGSLSDEYRYWQAEVYFQRSNYLAAADTFALLAQECTNSVRLLEAGYGEAQARFKLRDWPRVVDLLQSPTSTFRQAAIVRANDALVASGSLLLGEALLEQKEFKAAEQTVRRLSETNLLPEVKWRREYLLCRIQVADLRLEEALSHTTNLLALAVSSGQRNLLAESAAWQGNILQQLNQFTAAVHAYEQNLLDGAPAEYGRQALVRIVEIDLAQNQFAEAAQRLDTFFAKHASDAVSDLALLTLGEIHLKLHVTHAATNALPAGTNASPAVTNHLQIALLQFDRLISTFTNSPLLGKAQLDRGWGLWLDGRIPESLAAFKAAAATLPHSEDLGVARFKLADAQFRSKDYTNALANYQAVVNDCGDLPRVKHTLFDHAYYQILRVALQLNDLPAAKAAMSQILRWSPDSFYCDRSLLLVGQSLTLADQPGEAQALFAELAKRIPGSPLLPEVELAMAHARVQENDWAGAIAQYEQWIKSYPTNAMRPVAEFNRAWANFKAGRETNALVLFTNFVAQFSAHELAPRAQFWVATYYYTKKDYLNAEKNFQDKLLLQSSNFTYQARMMAGRSAIARQSYDQAGEYFQKFVSDLSCPSNLVAEALFALGDTITLQNPDPAKPGQRFGEAVVAFNKIPQLYPGSELVPRAWGRIGDCYLQMAALDAKNYVNATNAYTKALNADVTTRSQAEAGLAAALEGMARLKQPPENTALLKAAFTHYYNIVIGAKLLDGEQSDPFWLYKAGLAAANLAEESKQWDVALNIYNRLLKALPQLHGVLEKKIEKAREQTRAENN